MIKNYLKIIIFTKQKRNNIKIFNNINKNILKSIY